MKKETFIIAALISSFITTPISQASVLSNDFDQGIASYSEKLASSSNAENNDIPPLSDETQDSFSETKNENDVAEAVQNNEDIKITNIQFTIKGGNPLKEDNIDINLETEHCTVDNISLRNYNMVRVCLAADDGYIFSLNDGNDSIALRNTDGTKISGILKGKNTKEVIIYITFNITAESNPDDDITAEFEKAFFRFKSVMNEINTLGVRMTEANTKEELYHLVIGRFENAATENIEFKLKITDYEGDSLGKFVPAIAGTKDNPNGVNGHFGLRVSLWSKNDESKTRMIGEPNIVIYATYYNNILENDDGHEKNKTYENAKEDTISFYKNGKLISVPCTIYYDNHRYGNYTTIRYNFIEIEKFNGKNPNLIYNYTVLDNGGYSSTSTHVFIYVNGEKRETLGGTNSTWLVFNRKQISLPIPSHSFNAGDYVEIYIDGFNLKNANTRKKIPEVELEVNRNGAFKKGNVFVNVKTKTCKLESLEFDENNNAVITLRANEGYYFTLTKASDVHLSGRGIKYVKGTKMESSEVLVITVNGENSGGSSSGSSGGGSGGGGSSSGTGVISIGMLITKPNATSGTWEKTDDKWKLKLDNETYACSQWAMLGEKWYLFDENGYMVTGWKKSNSKWYLLSQSGEMVTGWQLVDGKWYWLEPSGEMATGWKWIGEKCYYLDTSGAMISNTTTPDGYFVNEKGEWVP